jgi:hypothetical protein
VRQNPTILRRGDRWVRLDHPGLGSASSAQAALERQSQEEVVARPERGVTIVMGRDLPPQVHLGVSCDAAWAAATDMDAGDRWLATKPEGALWTATETDRAGRGVRSTWSDLYYRVGYDKARAEGQSAWDRLRGKVRSERQWEVRPEADARIVRLHSLDDLVAARDRWPAPHGRISWEAMRMAGIDGVWVGGGALTHGWSTDEWIKPRQA